MTAGRRPGGGRAALPLAWAACIALTLLAGCGTGQPKPRTLPPQTLSRVEPESPELQETDDIAAEEGEAAEEPEEPADDSLIVIDTPTDPAARPSLIEAARAERERRREAGDPVHVITDKNLGDYVGGELTVIEPSAAAAEEAPSDAGDESAGEEESGAGEGPQEEQNLRKRDEDYWRNRALQIRLAWRDAEQRIQELELRAAELRQRFYAEDDAYYRDSQIKPAWDRVIDQLEEAKRSVVARQEDLAELMEEGRRAGALPGWLREGIEFEPMPKKESEDDEVLDPVEPVIMKEGEGG